MLSLQACLHVVQHIHTAIQQIKKCIDGENQKQILHEFGVRLHRIIYDHLQTMQFNTAGAMCAICDVNEYRKCIRELDSPLVTQLFDILHALCNLLLVKPENLLEVCTGETLVSNIKCTYTYTWLTFALLLLVRESSFYELLDINNIFKSVHYFFISYTITAVQYIMILCVCL